MAEKNLKKNSEFVEKNKQTLLREYKNKYILVHDGELIASFDTYDRAAEEGVQSFGVDGEFLVYHLLEKEPLNFIMEAVI